MAFRNESGLEFTDISSEHYREYNFGQQGFVRIREPKKLHVSASGGHRIWDGNGVSHYIPTGWIELTWKAKEGEPNFVK